MRFIKLKKAVKIFISYLKITLITLILICTTLFLVNNRSIITVNFRPFPFPSFETRVFLLIIISYLAGLFTAIIIYSSGILKSWFEKFKNKIKANNNKKINSILDKITEEKE